MKPPHPTKIINEIDAAHDDDWLDLARYLEESVRYWLVPRAYLTVKPTESDFPILAKHKKNTVVNWLVLRSYDEEFNNFDTYDYVVDADDISQWLPLPPEES